MDDLSLKELLKRTIPDSDKFEVYWLGKNKKSFSLFKLCNRYNYTSINDVEYLLADYLNEYPASSIYKERSLRPFIVQWYQNTVDYLGEYDDTETLFPHYVVKDKTVDLLKALHPREGVTKEEISRQLGVNGKNHKSVQTDLRLLSPSLVEGEKTSYDNKTLKVGGHVVRVEVKEERKGGKKYYHTPNTVHPMILLSNVSQIYTLLQSLANYSEKTGSDIAVNLGVDIWLQLSDYGKGRIRDLLANDDGKLREFLNMIENCISDSSEVGYLTEREMEEYISSVRERLMMAMKANRVCNLTLEINGERKSYQNQKIRLLKNHYRAVSVEDSRVFIDFSVEDVFDIEFIRR